MKAGRLATPNGAETAMAGRSRRLVTPARLVGGLVALFGGVIVVNAVVMQSDKHPSPLFRTMAPAPDLFPVPPTRPDAAKAAFAPTPLGGTRAPIERQGDVKPELRGEIRGEPKTRPPASLTEGSDVLVMEIQRELAKRGQFKGEADGRMGPATVQAIKSFQFAQRLPVDGKPSEELLQSILGAKVAMKDELLDLLKKTAEVDKPSRTVLDVQRALNKAGYGPLTEDGHMGPSTRNALAKFETDRKLPAKGEPKGPVLQILASVSGVAIAR